MAGESPVAVTEAGAETTFGMAMSGGGRRECVGVLEVLGRDVEGKSACFGDAVPLDDLDDGRSRGISEAREEG